MEGNFCQVLRSPGTRELQRWLASASALTPFSYTSMATWLPCNITRSMATSLPRYNTINSKNDRDDVDDAPTTSTTHLPHLWPTGAWCMVGRHAWQYVDYNYTMSMIMRRGHSGAGPDPRPARAPENVVHFLFTESRGASCFSNSVRRADEPHTHC